MFKPVIVFFYWIFNLTSIKCDADFYLNNGCKIPVRLIKSEKISKNSFNGKWPFKVDEVVLKCKIQYNSECIGMRNTHHALFEVDGIDYYLNGVASGPINAKRYDYKNGEKFFINKNCDKAFKTNNVAPRNSLPGDILRYTLKLCGDE